MLAANAAGAEPGRTARELYRRIGGDKANKSHSLRSPGWGNLAGKPFGQAVGVVLVAAGVLAIWFPWLLPGLHVAAMPAM